MTSHLYKDCFLPGVPYDCSVNRLTGRPGGFPSWLHRICKPFRSDSYRSSLTGLKSGHWVKVYQFQPLLPSSSLNEPHTLLWGLLGLIYTVTAIVYNCPVEVTHFLSYRNQFFQHSQTGSFPACLIKLFCSKTYVECEKLAAPRKSDGEMERFATRHPEVFTSEPSPESFQRLCSSWSHIHTLNYTIPSPFPYHSEFSSSGELHITVLDQIQQSEDLYYWDHMIAGKNNWNTERFVSALHKYLPPF